MPLKRNIRSTACAGMGIALETDVHHTTVARWELRLEQALRASMMKWYKTIEDDLRLQGGYCVHTVRSDATSARIWHQEKLHMVEIKSVYHVAPTANNQEQVNEYLGDILVVGDVEEVLRRTQN